MKKIVTFKLPEALESRLREYSEEHGESASSIVREALAEYLAKPRRRTPRNALSLVGDLAGSLEGPSDLATNPRHMQGFGE